MNELKEKLEIKINNLSKTNKYDFSSRLKLRQEIQNLKNKIKGNK